jgi:hypothetical protein
MHKIVALMERLRFVRELIEPNNGTMQRRAWQQGGGLLLSSLTDCGL